MRQASICHPPKPVKGYKLCANCYHRMYMRRPHKTHSHIDYHRLSALADIPIPMAKEVVKVMTKAMAQALHRGEGIQIRGFGTFRTVTRKVEVMKAPPWKVGRPITREVRKFVKFKPAQLLNWMLTDEALKEANGN